MATVLRVVSLVLVFGIAGCLQASEPAPRTSTPPSSSSPPSSQQDLQFDANVSPSSIPFGLSATVSYNITNPGPEREYWETFCSDDGNAILSIQVTDPMGETVHAHRPFGPSNPQCLAPDFRRTLAHGERLATNFTWDGRVYNSSEDPEGHAASPGLYRLHASFFSFRGSHIQETVWANVTLEIRPS